MKWINTEAGQQGFFWRGMGERNQEFYFFYFVAVNSELSVDFQVGD